MFSFFGHDKTKRTEENGSDERAIKKLENHPIFQEFQSFSTVQIDSLAIKDPLKKRMAVCYLKLLYADLEVGMRDIIRNYQSYCDTPSKIGEVLRESVVRTREKAIGCGVPQIFMYNYEPKTFSIISIIINVVIEVHRNNMYSSTYDELCSILDICLVYMRIGIDSAENLINDMNGELRHALVGSIFDK